MIRRLVLNKTQSLPFVRAFLEQDANGCSCCLCATAGVYHAFSCALCKSQLALPLISSPFMYNPHVRGPHYIEAKPSKQKSVMLVFVSSVRTKS